MPLRSLGNGLETTGFRVYKGSRSNKHLVSWSQKRCIKCQRFLSKFQRKYCSRCTGDYEEYERKRMESYHLAHPDAQYRPKHVEPYRY